jgi:hypothetical protein
MLTILLTLGIMLLVFAALSLRLFFIKGASVRGTCASQSPFLNKEGEVCGMCGRMPEHCENKEVK